MDILVEEITALKILQMDADPALPTASFTPPAENTPRMTSAAESGMLHPVGVCPGLCMCVF